MTIIHTDNDNHMNSTQGVPPKGPDNKNENVEKDKYPKRQIVWLIIWLDSDTINRKQIKH